MAENSGESFDGKEKFDSFHGKSGFESRLCRFLFLLLKINKLNSEKNAVAELSSKKAIS